MSTQIMKRLLTWPGIQYTRVMQKCVYEALAFIIPNLSPTMAVKCTEKKMINVVLHLETEGKSPSLKSTRTIYTKS